MQLILRLLINAAALWVATRVVSGISYTGDWPLLFAVALVFGVLNVVVRPILILLSLPILIVTLGLFLLVLNAATLLLTERDLRCPGPGLSRRRLRAGVAGRSGREHRQPGAVALPGIGRRTADKKAR